ncbi:DNA topoisomerase [Arthrobacter crystallopoietes BAB-32]|uniref:DNA topoisomerase n=1 Tax=Arthrobacter crystallopoietes BAB-32 TaxID=1246476 RepID=N1V6A5_9MICC|nr:DNA topoisomerase IB [Arthrobacter crystallopoietes]EMY33763.1 DNA topoisomerase [Arthrobacter crystallopoietes BAB-32]
MATQEGKPARKPRLRRSNCNMPGITRRRRGKGFSYSAGDGSRVGDPETLERIRQLAIPPAWRDVWISPAPNGHIQATGVDDAGRRQYLYHPRWRELKDREKFDRALDFADTLPRARPAVTRLLRGDEPTEERAYAAAFRLIDEGSLRIGNEEYAQTNNSFGVTTLQVQHVRLQGDKVELDFPAKSGQQWSAVIEDKDLANALRPLLQRGPEEQALAFQTDDGEWSPISSAGLNDFIREQCGGDFTAKDFRTWQGTVAAALALAEHAPERKSETARKKATSAAAGKKAISATARKKAVAAAMREVAEVLGNTPAIARKSYVDPRVVDRFMNGETLDAGSYRAAERSLRDLIT